MTSSETDDRKIRIAVLGASGYTGSETLRLAARHPNMAIVALTADRRAGQALGDVFPHLGGLDLPVLTRVEDVDWSDIDAAFCCLPHATTQEVVAGLPDHLKVIDLSADFRLTDPAVYAEWYGHDHLAPHLQGDAVYGLTEWARDDLPSARIAACPGCYPTGALLPLLPLVKDGLIDTQGIIVDAKSGVTGAGRAPKEAMLYGEVAEGVNAYGIAHHRHTPEMEQELSAVADEALRVTFTPHLIPINRGILSTIYVTLANGADVAAMRASLLAAYQDAPFVRVVPQGTAPATRHVRGSNHCLIGVFEDRVPGRAIIISAIDNLVKGSSGQAVQNFNLMFGLPETAGLQQEPLFP
jgi:N-acetyl-gamma-glutamyl-phosphate reductase